MLNLQTNFGRKTDNPEVKMSVQALTRKTKKKRPMCNCEDNRDSTPKTHWWVARALIATSPT